MACQCAETPLTKNEWIDRCARRLGDQLPGWGLAQLNTRAAALWRIADCLAPEEAADIASGWWDGAG